MRRVILDRLESAELSEDLWDLESTLDFVIGILQKDIEWLDAQDNLEGLTPKWADSRFTSLEASFQKETDYVFDDIPRNSAIDLKIAEIARKLLFKAVVSEDDARLAFTGYGEKEIYPSHIWVDFKGVVADKPRYVQSSEAVDKDSDCWLRSHAQSEAIHTYIRGYHVSFLENAKENLRENSEKLIDTLRSKLDVSLFNEIEQDIYDNRNLSVENIRAAFVKNSENRFVDPFTATLSGLPSTSLGKMAESLIQLQILRQSSQAIQDTVGGAVDVAVITLGNGFEWYRHKNLEDLWKGI